MKRKNLLLALLLLVFTTSAYAANYPAYPFGEMNSATEEQYPQVVNDWFNRNIKEYDLPTFTRPGYSTIEKSPDKLGRATSHEDMIRYLEALPETNMKMRYVAEFYTYDNESSPPGLGIPMKSFKFPLLVFTKEGVFDPADVKALGRPIVHLEGSIHGNEFAASESMLALAKRLATPGADLNALLGRVSVVMVPRYCFDGTFKTQRGTDTVQPRFYRSVASQDAGEVSRVAGVDQNRDNTGFESPIVRAVHMIWNAYEPHFIADGHEMGTTIPSNPNQSTFGQWWNFDIATLFTSNPNTPEELDELAHDGITIKVDPNNPATWDTADSLEHLVKRALRKAGLEWWNYVGTAYFAESNTYGPAPADYYTGKEGAEAWGAAGTPGYMLALGGYQEGNPEEGITDSVARIKGAFGLLTESRSRHIPASATSPKGATLNYNRRIQAHEIVYATIIEAFADPVKGPILKNAVERARKAMATGTSVRKDVKSENLVVAIQNQDPISHELETPGENGIPIIRVVREAPGSNAPKVSPDYLPTAMSRSRRVIALPESDRPHSTVKRPTAYIIMADPSVAARIAYTGIRIERLSGPVTVPVEYYTVTGFGHNQNFRGVYNVEVSQLPTGITAVEKGEKTMTFPKDTFVIFMDQYNSVHASLTVEPSAGRNFGNYWHNRAEDSKSGFLPVGLNKDYPAYRYMGDAKNLRTYFAGDITMLPFIAHTFIEWPLILTQEEKAKYTGNFRVMQFSSFVVNNLASDFKVYLKKTSKPGVWYAWDWTLGKAVRIFAGKDGYASLTKDNIGPGHEVIMFCAAQKRDRHMPYGKSYKRKMADEEFCPLSKRGSRRAWAGCRFSQSDAGKGCVMQGQRSCRFSQSDAGKGCVIQEKRDCPISRGNVVKGRVPHERRGIRR